MNQIEKLRDDGKRRDVALAQSPHQFGRVQGLQVDDARTLDQREQEICHLRQNVKQGQHAQQRVGGPMSTQLKTASTSPRKLACVSITPFGSAVVPEV